MAVDFDVGEIEEACHKFLALPPDVHLLCPKVSEDDDEDYEDLDEPGSVGIAEKERRIQEHKQRVGLVYRSSLIFGFPEDGAAYQQREFRSRTGGFLQTCAQCVRSWHRYRKPFLKHLSEYEQDYIVTEMENRLNSFDFARITAGLEGARDFIDSHNGTVEQRTFIEEDRAALLVALYEALCCIAYLSTPENRIHFNYVFAKVQQKRVLKLAEVLPTMTQFLFDESGAEKTRLAFAKASWGRMTRVSADDFEWAVKDSLEAAAQKVAATTTPTPQLQRFWEGFTLILNALGQDMVISALGSLNVQPNIYQMMLNHMGVQSEVNLALVLRVFCIILQKGPKGFWGQFSTYSPKAVAEVMFGSPVFKRLITQSREYSISMPEDKYVKGPVATSWVRPFVDSVAANRKETACDTILTLLEDIAKDNSLSLDGRLACYRGIADALLTALDAFLSPDFRLHAGPALMYPNRMLNLTLKHKDMLIGMAKMDRQHMAMSQMALSIIGAALELDSRVTAEEYSGYVASDDNVQRDVKKQSSNLWDAFFELLIPGATELAKTMLLATSPLLSVEAFRPKKKEQLSQPKEEFNTELHKTAESIGRVIEKLAEINGPHLNNALLGPQTIKPIVATLVNGEAPINHAGLAFIKTVSDEDSRGDAVFKVLESHFSPLLVSFAEVVDEVSAGKIWSPQQHLLRYSKDILDGLCDSTVGILRSKNLDDGERVVLNKWWRSQWTFVESAFDGLEIWSKAVETDVMKEFCRLTMEHADALLAQTGLISSALGATSISDSVINTTGNAAQAPMKDILVPPRDKCLSMAKMLRLKDLYLVEVTVNVFGKLLKRLVENEIDVPLPVSDYIRKTCNKTPQGKYVIPTNLKDQQRAELLRSLGEDDDDDIQVVQIKKVEHPKKQSKLDSWSRSGDMLNSSSGSKSQSTVANRTSTNDFNDVTPSLEKNRGLLEKMRAAQGLKAETKPKLTGPRIDSKQPAVSAAQVKESRMREREAKKKRDADAIARANALRAPKPLVSGEGSGLQGLAGIQGKDHAPRSEMMVESSSDDDDSEDDAAFLAQTEAGRQRAIDAKRVRDMKLQLRGPVKKTKIQRSAKDMRARLIPPMDVLHQAILDWDIFHEGNDPPNGIMCSKVSNTYGDPRQYKDTFLPMLINEAWRSFVTAKDETTSKPYTIKVINRMSVDKFIEVNAAMPMDETKDQWLAEGDIVILSASARPLEARNEPHCLARISRAQNKKGVREVSYRLSGKAGPMITLLTPKAEFYGVKITSMTTIEREYAALESLQYYDLMSEILNAEPSPILTFGGEAISNVMSNYHLNQGQAKVILNAKANDAFTLVQGPPGTGKTKTIVAMVGALMTGNLTPNTGTAIKTPGQNSAQGLSKKLLVCAPSNAAVDELVLRLKQGVKSMNGSFHKINVLRLGRPEAVNAAVKDVTLEELVRVRLEGDKAMNSGPTDRQKMHEEAAKIKTEMAEVRPMLVAARASEDRNQINQLQRRFDELKRRQDAIGARIDADKDSGNTAQRESEIRRRQIQQEILDSAQVLCATLSGSGHEMFKNLNVEFETVIIDEAAQCVELSALIPLKYGCSKCILVGDPKQLPPTVLSQSAQRYGYDQSLFVRMQQNHPKDVHLLDQQYRMHPEISQFPSLEFYEGRLADGDDMARLRHQPWHQTGLLGPYRFFDVKGSQERANGKSLTNTAELNVAMQLYERFRLDNPRVDLKGKIGIITPYKAQLRELRDRFAARYGAGVNEEIEFNTTDAFQGRECEIIIFSCVRASPTGGIGFMNDIRRMNVGLTRAKSSLWVLGDSRALAQGEFWNKLIENAKARDRYTTGDILSLLQKPGAKLPPPNFSKSASPAHVIQQQPQEILEIDDVDMKDAPPIRPSSSHKKYAPPSETYTVLERPTDKFSNISAGFSGINARGEPVADTPPSLERPIIHSSSGQKRPRDSTADGGQPAKRSGSGFLPGKSAPTRPRAMPPTPRPTDPSAMSVLGIPPTGPSAKNSGPGPRPPNAPAAPANRQPNPMVLPKKKPAADPFIKRKPNRPR